MSILTTQLHKNLQDISQTFFLLKLLIAFVLAAKPTQSEKDGQADKENQKPDGR